jgi:hypothetical protein
VFRLAYLRLEDADEAADIAQETFLWAIRWLHRYDAGRCGHGCGPSPPTWPAIEVAHWADSGWRCSATDGRSTSVLGAASPPPRRVRRPSTPSASVACGRRRAGWALAAAVALLAGFEIRLPPELGAPERVFYQSAGPTVILVREAEARGRITLFILGDTILLDKHQPIVLQQTEVHGQPAYWTDGPSMGVAGERDLQPHYLVQGHALIWDEQPLTYRLEADLPLQEAIRLAGSLQP